MLLSLAFLYARARRSVSIAYAAWRDNTPAVDGKTILTIVGAPTLPLSLMTVESSPSDFGGLIPCLDLAGLSRRDLILVAGPGALPAMLWLCRHGYERAMHLNALSPRCASEAADALFVPHLSGPGGLTSILPAAGYVRQEGVLILRTSGGLAVGPVELLSAGWGLQRRLTEKGHAVLVARRPVAGHVGEARRDAA